MQCRQIHTEENEVQTVKYQPSPMDSPSLRQDTSVRAIGRIGMQLVVSIIELTS